MIKQNLVVKNGSYTTRDGQEKHRYLTIGQLHEHDGRMYVTLDAHINLAAIPRKDGDTRVIVSLYDPKPRDSEAPKKAAPVEDDGFGDEIPFN